MNIFLTNLTPNFTYTTERIFENESTPMVLMVSCCSDFPNMCILPLGLSLFLLTPWAVQVDFYLKHNL